MAGAYDLSSEELAGLLAGEPAYRKRQVRRALAAGRRPAEMTDLPLELRRHLDAVLMPALRPVRTSVSDGGDTVKFLWELDGGARVETVLMAYPDRVTVCVSTQAGCAMGCTFCATGQAGFTRQLTAGEIVEQVVNASRVAAARGWRVTNVVFMGMGEPLANYDRWWAAVQRLHGDLGFSARRLTVSTVGVVPGIRRLAAADLPVNLAVSLHAANDALRDELVPLNRRYPLAVLLAACEEYVIATHRRLSFEWAVIAGTNDRERDAEELATIARPLKAHVNLIPLNPTPTFAGGRAPAGGPAAAETMATRLRHLGVNVTVRANRGAEIDAACGQLAARPGIAEPAPAGTVSSPAGTAT